MANHTFQEGIPSGFTPGFSIGIFHDQRHLQLQSAAGWHSFVSLDTSGKTIEALVHFHVNETIAASPFRSPYGSYLFSEKITSTLLVQFINFVEMILKERGVQTILLKNPPEQHWPQRSVSLNEALSKSSYRVKLEETSAIIPVNDLTYEEILHRSKKSRLKRAFADGYVFNQLSPDHLKEVYGFLKTCREEKDYSLSMSYQEMQKVTHAFPDNFLLHTVTYDKRVIAASISILAEPGVLYVFYYDHAEAYDETSPVVFLCNGLYEFCQQNNVMLLDLGASNVDGVLVESLLNFKLSLGAQPSRKLTFVKNL